MINKENLLYGIRVIIEAINSGKQIDRIFLQKGINNELLSSLRKLIREFNIPFQMVPIEKLNRLTRKNHQGAVCFISPVIYQRIEDILPKIYEDGKVPLLIILDRITDVRNFGAISRTAECAGAQAIIIPEKGAASVNADAVKTSAGALHKIPVCREYDIKKTIDFLKDSGLQIISATEKSTEYYYSVDFIKPTAIIMGSEENGVSEKYLNKSDKNVSIPIIGEIESLNVSVAAGIMIYEAIRQREGSYTK